MISVSVSLASLAEASVTGTYAQSASSQRYVTVISYDARMVIHFDVGRLASRS